MKHIFVFCAWLLAANSFVVNAQIANGGFEDWNANGSPVSWQASNAAPVYTTILKSSDAHSGSWAVEGDVAPFSVFTIGPSLISGEEAQGIPVNFRPGALTGYYKFVSVQNDFLEVQANFKKNGAYIGGGANFLSPAGAYTQFSISVNNYITPDIPDSVVIAIFVSNSGGFPHVGTKIFIDDLAWGNATDVSENEVQVLNKFMLNQNYPNPFNPTTKISYSIPEKEQVELKIFDLIGNEVATLVNETKEQGVYKVNFDARTLSSGIYFYKLQAGSFIETKKMILLR